MARAFLAACSALALLGTAAVPVAAASRTDVLLVVNTRSPEGARVADAYRTHRDIPDTHVVSIDVAVGDQVGRNDYLDRIEQPLIAWFHRRAAHDDITYIVLTSGVPLRVLGTLGRDGSLASVDSELALLYRRMTGELAGPTSWVTNPYARLETAEDGWPAFDRTRLDIYLVTRLDGFTGDDAVALAGRCTAPAPPDARFVLDDRAPGASTEHVWFRDAAAQLTAMLGAEAVVLDQALAVVRGERQVMGYYSWGSADPGRRQRRTDLEFAPGAIGSSLSSSDVRTFVAPPETWMPGSWQQQDRFYRNSPEWLAGDLVKDGITGWAGYVADPYIDGAVRPHVLFPAYAAGRTLGEAFYLATPFLSWRTVVLGDPLCQPFGMATPPALPLPRDERSGLTKPFLDRVLTHLSRSGGSTSAESAAMRVAARARLNQGDRSRAIAILDELLAKEPKDLAAWQMKAVLVDQRTDRDAAIATYEAVLVLSPGDVVASNNLAFALAEDPARRAKALELARSAFERSRGDATVADTYGWVLYRNGDAAQAVRVLRDAVARRPRLVDAQVHLALALLATGDVAGARDRWQKALTLDAAAASRPDAEPLIISFGRSVSKP